MSDSGNAFGVDTDEVRAAGNAVLRASDAVEAAGRSRVMTDAGRWGDATAESAGVRFANRFEYLLQGLGTKTEGAGSALRSSASTYDDMDFASKANFDVLDDRW